MIRLLPVLLLMGCAGIEGKSTDTSCSLTGGQLTGDFISEAKDAGDSACVLFHYKTEECHIQITSSGCPAETE